MAGKGGAQDINRIITQGAFGNHIKSNIVCK